MYARNASRAISRQPPASGFIASVGTRVPNVLRVVLYDGEKTRDAGGPEEARQTDARRSGRFGVRLHVRRSGARSPVCEIVFENVFRHRRRAVSRCDSVASAHTSVNTYAPSLEAVSIGLLRRRPPGDTGVQNT